MIGVAVANSRVSDRAFVRTQGPWGSGRKSHMLPLQLFDTLCTVMQGSMTFGQKFSKWVFLSSIDDDVTSSIFRTRACLYHNFVANFELDRAHVVLGGVNYLVAVTSLIRRRAEKSRLFPASARPGIQPSVSESKLFISASFLPLPLNLRSLSLSLKSDSQCLHLQSNPRAQSTDATIPSSL